MSPSLLRASVIAATVALAASRVAASPPTTLPFKDVRAGMKGTGKTVFHGDTIESFDVEIVGLLPNIGPGQNLILGRCTGGPLAQTGVLAGMSGSPVTIDGKLVGAVAYSWGFAKEAIAGITPIEEMLAVGARDAASPRKKRQTAAMPWNDALAHVWAPSTLGTFLSARLSLFAARPAGMSSSIPLSIAGIDPAGLARIAPDLARAGFLPLQSGGTAVASATTATPLQPGSAVGVKLVRGDVDMTATGTVTWVDDKAVYAFGHPLYGLGDVDLPLTEARVEALLPSLEQSSKIAIPLREVGAFTQDRAGAIFGRLGATPSMIPVRLQLTDASGAKRTFSFDLVDDPLLSPILLYNAMNGVLGTIERTFGSTTVRLSEGSIIKVDGDNDVRIDNLFAGDDAATDASGLSAFFLYLVMNNAWSSPHIAGVNLIMEYERAPRSSIIQRVTLDRYRVKAGTSLKAQVLLLPYRGTALTLTREIEIPEETLPGPLTLQFGDAVSMNRVDNVDGPIMPRSFENLVALINRLKRNDRVYVLASREDSGVLIEGARLANLPPSITSILTRPRSFGNSTFIQERGVLETELPADGAVSGFARVSIEVTAP